VALWNNKINFTVQDDGKGFPLPENIEELANFEKLGLVGMKERAKLIGGQLTLQSELNKGTF